MVATEKLTLLHLNDVYNVESRDKPEPVGGAARMRTAFKKYSDRNPLILFSGGAFAPSICKFLILQFPLDIMCSILSVVKLTKYYKVHCCK